MSHTDIAFFLAPDGSAASAHLGGPRPHRFASVRGHYFDAYDAVEEWDTYFVGLSQDLPGRGQTFWQRTRCFVGLSRDLRRRGQTFWQQARWIVPVSNDGSGMFALPPRLTRALASAGAEELEELAARWAERLRRLDGDDMTDDDLLAVMQGVARLATSTVTTGGDLYCWFY
ncbi:hypothetical protein [Kitasatospora sp. GP82]|uniref:hypothetical protein n=1 Tax=Kitasatospora sp. GP82 TaxID=3035089 RepID=UPI002476F824|nr:hypothetical protein [Kitasatospora sp. GP82]MDH6130093.1 hypothetical protein [Kitasatospora sp. GP82]